MVGRVELCSSPNSPLAATLLLLRPSAAVCAPRRRYDVGLASPACNLAVPLCVVQPLLVAALLAQLRD